MMLRFYLLFFVASFTMANLSAQTTPLSEKKSNVIQEAEFAFNMTMEQKRSRSEKLKDRKELKVALGSAFSFNGKKGLSIIIESGNINSFVRNNTNTSDSKLNFLTKSDAYIDLGGFSTGMKVAKNLSTNSFDLKLDIDIISGLVYKYTMTHQKGLRDYTNFNTFNNFAQSGTIICGNFGPHPQVRDIKTSSIEIPIEIRTSYQINKFLIAPTFGFGLDFPISSNQTHYFYDVVDGEYLKENISHQSKEKGGSVNLNLISKLELAYILNNNHKLKIGGFYSANVSERLPFGFNDDNRISSSGFQIAYEFPLSK